MALTSNLLRINKIYLKSGPLKKTNQIKQTLPDRNCSSILPKLCQKLLSQFWGRMYVRFKQELVNSQKNLN